MLKEKSPLGQDWIGQAAGGDEEAFALLVEQYKGYLLAVILPIVRDPDQAQDVLQEAFWQIYLALPRYRGGNLKVWLARIAAHKAIDWRRRQERRAGEVVLASPGECGTAAARSAEEEYLGRLSGARLAGLFNNLPPPYKATLAGYVLEGKSYRQLADEAGTTVKTVESRLYRARQMIKEQLKEGV
jgi:RNA polymerase sigma factor (sigma-70 family)